MRMKLQGKLEYSKPVVLFGGLKMPHSLHATRQRISSGSLQKLCLTIAHLVILSLFATSCASFPEYKLPQVTNFTNFTGSGQLPSIHFDIHPILINPVGRTTSASGVFDSTANAKIREIVRRVADESGMLDSSFDASDVADYVLQIEIVNNADVSNANGVIGFISGFSLLAIPIVVTDVYIFKATLSVRDAPALKTYEYEDAIETWVGILFLPVVGKTPQKAFDEVIENMVRTLFIDLGADQAFASSS